MSLKKLKTELPYDPAIPLLGIYLERTIIWKDTCAPHVHCSTIYDSQDMEQSECPSIEDWIKEMWYYIQRTITQPQERTKQRHLQQRGCTERLSYWVKSARQRKTHIIWYRLHVESKKKKSAKELISKTEIELWGFSTTEIEKKLLVTSGWGERGINWKTGIDIDTLLSTKQIIRTY